MKAGIAKAGAPDRLATLVADCTASGINRHVLLLRLDRLPASLTRPHHLRLAEAALAPLLRASRAEMFQLPGQRLAVAWRGDADGLVLDAIDDLQHLLTDAPAPALPDLVCLYDLPGDGALLLAALADEHTAPPCATPAIPPLDPASLLMLEATLVQADISRFARRQAVWRDGPQGWDLAWEKRTLCLKELAETMAPGHDLEAEPWLFRRLSRTLDRRMLALLACPEELARAGAFALDVNVASVLGAEFLRFDAALPQDLRGQVRLALNPTDLIADAAAFGFARAFLRTRSYRVMLRDASPGLLALLSAEALDVDCFLLPWTPGLPQRAESLAPHDPQTLVLECGADPAALAWGRAAGLTLFTGAAVKPVAAGWALGESAGAA